MDLNFKKGLADTQKAFQAAQEKVATLARELKADMKERFFPAGDKWREMVWSRADQTIGWALKGMTGG